EPRPPGLRMGKPASVGAGHPGVLHAPLPQEARPWDPELRGQPPAEPRLSLALRSLHLRYLVGGARHTGHLSHGERARPGSPGLEPGAAFSPAPRPCRDLRGPGPVPPHLSREGAAHDGGRGAEVTPHDPVASLPAVCRLHARRMSWDGTAFDLIVFDLDGVLVDTTACHRRAYDDLWRRAPRRTAPSPPAGRATSSPTSPRRSHRRPPRSASG